MQRILLRLRTVRNLHPNYKYIINPTHFSTNLSSPAEWTAKYPSQDNTPEDWSETAQFNLIRPEARPNEQIEIKRKRLVWESRKRGILETDLLLGTFFEKFGGGLSLEGLEEYDRLLDENDWDIYYWCTGAKKVPERIQNFSFWTDLVEHAKNPERKILRMPEVN